MSDFNALMGWVDHPDRGIVAARHPTLFAAAPYLQDTDDGRDILLYRAWSEVIGKYPDYPAQQIGDCTSFGAGHALDLLQCVEIATGERDEEFKEICTEAIYGMGREIAGMLRSGDGCYGGAVAEAVGQGALSREEVGPYSGQRAKDWGRKGVPQEVKLKASKQKLRTAALVKTLPELDAALVNGHPVTVASNQGFTMARDANGICQPRGSWAHQMFLLGRAKIAGATYYLIGQSWGPNVPSGPTPMDIPNFCFFAPSRTVGSMLGVGDSWSFAGWDGFKRRDLPSGWSYMGMS